MKLNGATIPDAIVERVDRPPRRASIAMPISTRRIPRWS